MRILVTGAAGFIGFHVCKQLLSLQHQVIGLDNLSDYYDPALKTARLSLLGIDTSAEDTSTVKYEHNGFIFYKADITDKKSLDAVFEQHPFDVVINLAAQPGIRFSIKNPDASVNNNILGFFNVLDCVRKYRSKHFVFASSSSIYGNNKVPFDVNDNTDKPVSLYAATKKANEVLAYSYSHLHKIKTTGLRFFTVYGPWGRPDMAYFSFTKSIIEGAEIQLFNNGHLYRDFTFIDDIVKGIVAVAENTNEGNSTVIPYTIYNIGNDQPVQLLEFVKTLEEIIGKKANVKMMPMQPGDVFSTHADITELEKDYGFAPVTALKTGLSEFVQWYKGFYQ